MIYCENIVKILWTWQLFFLLIHRFHNFFFHFRQWDCHNCQNIYIYIYIFFFLHYRQWDCHNCQNNFFLHYQQLDCHNCQNIYIYIYFSFFFFCIIGNGIATIANIYIFFTFSVMPLSQLICHKFFELIIINHVWFIMKIL